MSGFGTSHAVHVAHVGHIDTDLGGSGSVGLLRVACAFGSTAGTACYVAQ